MKNIKKSVTQYIYKYKNGAIDDKGYKYSYGEYSLKPNLIKHTTFYNPDGTIDYTQDIGYDQNNHVKSITCYNFNKTLRYKMEYIKDETNKLTDCIYYRDDNSIILHFKFFDNKYSEIRYNLDGTIISNNTIDFDQENEIIEFIDDDKKIIKAVKYTITKRDENDKEIELKSEFDHWIIKRENGNSEIKVIKNNGELDYIKKTINEYV